MSRQCPRRFPGAWRSVLPGRARRAAPWRVDCHPRGPGRWWAARGKPRRIRACGAACAYPVQEPGPGPLPPPRRCGSSRWAACDRGILSRPPNSCEVRCIFWIDPRLRGICDGPRNFLVSGTFFWIVPSLRVMFSSGDLVIQGCWGIFGLTPGFGAIFGVFLSLCLVAFLCCPRRCFYVCL